MITPVDGDVTQLWNSQLLTRVQWRNRDILTSSWQGALDNTTLTNSKELTADEIQVRNYVSMVQMKLNAHQGVRNRITRKTGHLGQVFRRDKGGHQL